MDELIAEFLEETGENLETLDQGLENLERNPNDKEQLCNIFRVVHSIKGTCGFFHMPRLTMVAHHLENVLEYYRDHDRELPPPSISVIGEACEAIKSIIDDLAKTGKEPDTDFTALIKKLDAIHEAPAITGRIANFNAELCGDIPMYSCAINGQQNSATGLHRIPIGKAWSKLPHILQNLCAELDKKIDLQMSGQDIELEAQILELIKDPLIHMLRNAVDHGIETPPARLAAGKPETGQVIIKAVHDGGHLVIEISDDGKGLPTDKIKTKILSNGLASAQELERMSPTQIQRYIFKHGISTAERVSAVSGRGVGLDVVRANIEKIGGTIALHSEDGKGARFTITIPMIHSTSMLLETRKADYSDGAL